MTDQSFLNIGCNLSSPHFGARYCKVSDSVHIPYYGSGVYFGEFSCTSHKPHGRGVFVSKDGWIFLNFFEEGVDIDGKYINICAKEGYFQVGEENTIDGTTHCKETRYHADGRIELFNY